MLKESLPPLTAVYLYGSHNTDFADYNSDWDFEFLHRPVIEPVILWEVKSNIESKVQASIDLVDLYLSSTLIQIEVIKKGRLIWSNDDYEVATFEYMAISLYLKLDLERACVLKDLHQRGNIYG